MIIVIASISVKSGEKSKFIEIFKENVPRVLAEKGCIDYLPAIDFDSGMPQQVTDQNLVTVIEKWESLEALWEHLASPHMQQYQAKVKEIVTGASLKILQPA